MKVLAIDPSLSCTGWALSVDDETIHMGSIPTSPSMELNDRIAHIVKTLQGILNRGMNDVLDMVYIEGEAYGAKGQVVQLAELCGALKYHFTSQGIKVLTMVPSQARKIGIGISKIPHDKTKHSDEYIAFILNRMPTFVSRLSLGESGVKFTADPYDALVVLIAGLRELTDAPRVFMESLLLQRLRDHKILTKGKNGKYTFGTKKKEKESFKTLDKASNGLQKVLLEKYWSLLGKTRTD